MAKKMFWKILITSSCLFFLGGCVFNSEPMPEIAYDYKLEEPVKVIPPRATYPEPDIGNIPRSWLPAPYLEKKWTAIVIHHSGTKSGNSAIFDKWHREGRHWEGVGYDFVIGNGTDSGNGQVEVTYRWRNQVTGAHCGGTPGNWANEDAVGICLVGDFNKTVPNYQQMASLAKLVRFLQRRYGISKSNVYGHNTTPGARITDCPGKNFPMAKLKSMLE